MSCEYITLLSSRDVVRYRQQYIEITNGTFYVGDPPRYE